MARYIILKDIICDLVNRSGDRNLSNSKFTDLVCLRPTVYLSKLII